MTTQIDDNSTKEINDKRKQATNENRKYRIWTPSHLPRTNGGCDRHRLPTAVQALRSIYGVHRVCKR